MKRKIILLAVAALAMAAGSCKSRERLSIYNWSYYTPDSVIKKFEKEFNVKVTYDEFSSNEEMYAKLRAGGGGYDIVFPSADYVSIMIRQGMLERLDRSKMPNLRNIDPAVLRIASYDPVMDYSVPYFYGATGIAVNTGMVPGFQRDLSIFSRSDLRGRMTMQDDIRQVIGDALMFLGYSVNSTNPAEIAEARDHINSQWKPNLTKFDSEPGKGYANGEFWVVQTWAEVVYEEIADNDQLVNDTVFFIPEGSSSYIDTMCILKDSKNVDLAHKFIDFIHRPEIYAEFVDEYFLPSTVNVPARRLKEGPALYDIEDMDGTELQLDIGAALEFYTDAWFNSIRAGN
jgi:spermidine/putrescine transport system substrate-binding protein